MITPVCAGLTLAFLAPVPPMREWTEKPKRPARGSVHWLVLSLYGGLALLFAASPIGASRAYDGFRVRCETAGGTVLHSWHGRHPYTCDHRRAAPN